MKDINLDNIFKELQADTKAAIEKATKDVAKEGVAKLRKQSPARTGTYAKSWGSSKSKDTIIIHNKKRAGLTHLLEKGHAKRGGGRVAPIKHIEPVEEWIIKEVEDRIAKELE